MAFLKKITLYSLIGLSLACSDDSSENPSKKPLVGSVWEIKRVEIIDPSVPQAASVILDFEISNASHHSYLIFRNEEFIDYVDQQLGVNSYTLGTCGQWDIDVDQLQFVIPKLPAEIGGCASKNGVYYTEGAYTITDSNLTVEGWGSTLGRISLESPVLDRVISGSLKSRSYFERVTSYPIMEPACCPTLNWVN